MKYDEIGRGSDRIGTKNNKQKPTRVAKLGVLQKKKKIGCRLSICYCIPCSLFLSLLLSILQPAAENPAGAAVDTGPQPVSLPRIGHLNYRKRVQRLERLLPIPSMKLSALLTMYPLCSKTSLHFIMVSINFAPIVFCQVVIYLLTTFFEENCYCFSLTKTLNKNCVFLLMVFINFTPRIIDELTKPLFPYPFNKPFHPDMSFRFRIIMSSKMDTTPRPQWRW